MKTESELRKALVDVGIYSPEEIDQQVATALAKGAIASDEAPNIDLSALDAAAVEWAAELEKGSSADEDASDEEEPAEVTDSDVADDDDDIEVEIVKALTKAVMVPIEALRAEVAALTKAEAKSRKRIEALGGLTKALVDTTRQQLIKVEARSMRLLMGRLDTIEKAITGPRGDFRGVASDGFASAQHPGDAAARADLTKAIDPKKLTTFLLDARRKARTDGDERRDEALHKALMSIDVTTTPAELAQFATDFGFRKERVP